MRVRLISLTGEKVFEAEIANPVKAIIFSNQVFLFADTFGDWNHYSEVVAERVHYLETASTASPPLKEELL